MNKRFLPLLMSLWIASLATSLGNVGDSEATVENSYGKSFGQIPTPTFGVMSGFVAGGYVIGVKFVDGASEMEMFSKGDQSEMPASEINRLLQKNSPGDWKAELTDKPRCWRRWRRDDGTAIALYNAASHFLYINSRNFYELKGQQMEQQECNFTNPPQLPKTGGGATAIPAVTPSPAATP
jgi:hypothetical protein